MIASQLELLRLNTGREIHVATANTLLKRMLFRYQGYVSAALVLGGVDNTGPHIFSIHPHGSTDKLPYTTMGSGSLAAMAVFEGILNWLLFAIKSKLIYWYFFLEKARWRPNLEEEEAKRLVRDAIAAGVFNDLGSGSNVDLCVIRKGSVDYLRGYEYANKKGQRAVSVYFYICFALQSRNFMLFFHVFLFLAELRLQIGHNNRSRYENP